MIAEPTGTDGHRAVGRSPRTIRYRSPLAGVLMSLQSPTNADAAVVSKDDTPSLSVSPVFPPPPVLATWDVRSGNQRQGPVCSSISLTGTKRSISTKGMFRTAKPTLNKQASRSLSVGKRKGLIFVRRRKTDRVQPMRFQLDIPL